MKKKVMTGLFGMLWVSQIAAAQAARESVELEAPIENFELTESYTQVKAIEDFEGDESQCFYSDALQSQLCLDQETLYLDSNLIPSNELELKLGGSLGKAVGKITNPIRDNITKPANKALGGAKGIQCGIYFGGTLVAVGTGNIPGTLVGTGLATKTCM